MMKLNIKNALLTTSAICAIGAFANNARADEMSDYLNDSPYKSPDISWSAEIVGTDNIVNIGGKDYQYTIIGLSRDKYTNDDGRQTLLSGNITADFLEIAYNSGSSDSHAGAIYSNGTIETLTGDFIGNYAEANNYSDGGAIYNYNTSTISNITGNFIGNYAYSTNNIYAPARGGAIYNNSAEIGNIAGNFIGNYTYSNANGFGPAEGGAIYNNTSTISNITGNFIGNYTYSNSSPYGAKGGAIYLENGTINMLADGFSDYTDILFHGNYVQVGEEEKQYEAIYNKGSSAILTFTSNNGGSYTFYDYINGDGAATINFVSDDKEGATFNLYNDIKGQANINFQNNYVLNMISPSDIHKDVFTSKYSYIQAENITIKKAIEMYVDVDLVALEMDMFKATNFTIESTGYIDVKQFKIVTENEESDIGQPVNVQFIKATGTTSGLNLVESVTEAVGDVYAYSVEYDGEGNFIFTKTGLAPQPEPAGPTEEETTASTANAAVEGVTHAVVEALAGQVLNRDVAAMSGLNSGDAETLSTWVQVFGSNDDVELKHLSSAIDTQFYGVVGGIDSKKFVYDNGVNAVYGVYGAYTNGRQKYDGNKITQKGGYLGLSAALRKEAWFNNVTLNGGYLKNEANTKFGKDKFDTKVVSLANKTGVDIKKNELTITPALTLGYMGIDTEDYTTKAGTKVDNKLMNVFTVAPELKISKDFGEGLNGYAKAAYKMFFYDNAKVKVDSVLLPNMSVKPYVEYGVGVKKDWSQTEWSAHDVATFAEITRHDGGREGWDINLGLKLDF